MKFNIDGTCDNCESQTQIAEVLTELGDDKSRLKTCEYCFNLDDEKSNSSKDMARMFVILEHKINNYKDMKGLIADKEALKLKVRAHLTLLDELQTEVKAHSIKGFSKKDNELNNVYKLVQKGLAI